MSNYAELFLTIGAEGREAGWAGAPLKPGAAPAGTAPGALGAAKGGTLRPPRAPGAVGAAKGVLGAVA